MYEEITTLPLVVPVDILAELATGGDLRRAYELINSSIVKTLPIPGRKRALVTSIETIVGRRLTVDDVRDAERRASAKREKRSNYLKDYNQRRAPTKAARPPERCA